jgi:hypothetical protein
LGCDQASWLATHPRARERGSWVIDPTQGVSDRLCRGVTSNLNREGGSKEGT